MPDFTTDARDPLTANPRHFLRCQVERLAFNASLPGRRGVQPAFAARASAERARQACPIGVQP